MLNVIYEDNHIIVVEKPAGVPTQADYTKDIDMYNLVRDYLKEKYNKPGQAFVGIVHRLDRPFGGIMVFAKTSKAAERLCADFKEHDLEKNYLAVINGKLKQEKGTLVNWLKKNQNTNKVYVATSITEGAKRAELNYQMLETFGPISLVKINLQTGRSHQIRVQMAAQNCPLFGDVKYGDKLSKGSNLALWAYELKFTHPVTKDSMVFVAYPPEEKEPWKKFELKDHLEKYYY